MSQIVTQDARARLDPQIGWSASRRAQCIDALRHVTLGLQACLSRPWSCSAGATHRSRRSAVECRMSGEHIDAHGAILFAHISALALCCCALLVYDGAAKYC